MLHGSSLSRRSFLFGVAQKNVLNNIWAAPLLVLYRIITECFFGYEIQAAATIETPLYYPSRLRRSDQ